MKGIYFSILTLALFSCANIQPTQERSKDDRVLEEIAKSNFGDNYAALENEKGDYVLVLSKYKRIEDLVANVKFFVYRKEGQSILFQDELKAGSVKWHSNYEISTISRNVNNGRSTTATYTYNVLTKEKNIK